MVDWRSAVKAQAAPPTLDELDRGTDAPAKGDWRSVVKAQKRPQAELTQGPEYGDTGYKSEGGYAKDVDSPEFGFKENLRASLAPDDETKIKRYSEMSGIPINRFGKIEGDIVYFDDNLKKYVPVTAQVGGGDGIGDKFMRAGELVASGTGGAIPDVAGAVTGMVLGPTGASIPAAGAVAGIVETGRQALDKSLAGEDTSLFDGDYDWGKVLGSATINLIGQGVGTGLVKLFNRNPMAVQAYDRIRAKDPKLIQEAVDLQKVAQDEFGISLTTGQATEMRSLLIAERQAARWPETADMVAAKRDTQWGEQVPAAITKEISKIAPESGEAASLAFKGGANKIVSQAEKKAADDARGFYDTAFKANQDVASKKLDRILETKSGKAALREAADIMDDKMALMGKADPELTEAMRDLAARGEGRAIPGGVSKGLKLRTWDFIKQGLWRVEEAAKGEGGKATSRSNAIGDLRRGLTKELDNLDATGGDYARARGFFQDGIEAKDAILSGGIAILKKDKSDTVRLVNKIFNEGNVTPEEVQRMRAKFYAGGQGPAWEAGVARWLEGALNLATKEFKQGTGNVPGTFYARVWGTGQQKAITSAAIGNKRMPGFEKFLKVLDHARKSLPEGSPTSTDMLSNAPDAVSTGLQRIGKGLSLNTYANPGDIIASGVAAIRQPAARIRLAEALFSEDGTKLLRKLRMLSPRSGRAVQLIGDFMVKSGFAAGAAALDNETSGAPAGTGDR